MQSEKHICHLYFLLCIFTISLLRGTDLNRRPRGYEPRELPGCSTPLSFVDIPYYTPFYKSVNYPLLIGYFLLAKPGFFSYNGQVAKFTLLNLLKQNSPDLVWDEMNLFN